MPGTGLATGSRGACRVWPPGPGTGRGRPPGLRRRPHSLTKHALSTTTVATSGHAPIPNYRIRMRQAPAVASESQLGLLACDDFKLLKFICRHGDTGAAAAPK